MEEKQIVLNGKTFTFHFPSLIRAQKVGDILGFDPLKDSPMAIPWIKFWKEDKPKIVAALSEIFKEKITADIFDDVTLSDLARIGLDFFMDSGRVHATLTSGEDYLKSILNQAMQNMLREAITLTSPSIPSVGETQD